MHRRSYVRFIVTSAVLFIAGLALGAGKSSEDTSAANTASKVLLMVGLLALVITVVLEIASRRRARSASVGGQARRVLSVRMTMHFTTRVMTVVVAAGVTLAASPADAKPVTTTEHEFKAVNVLVHIDNPCTGVPGTLTEVENGVAHLTAAGVDLGDPSDPIDDRPIPPYTSTFNVENHFTFVPDDPNQPSYVGHSHTHISERFAAFPGIMQFENNIRPKGTTARSPGARGGEGCRRRRWDDSDRLRPHLM